MSAADHTAVLINRVYHDSGFQQTLQRYHHDGGTSVAIARAALRAVGLGGGAILLPAPQGPEWTVRESIKTTWLESYAGDVHAESFVKLWANDNGWAVEYWHPAYWYQNLSRTDEHGRRWHAEGSAHVMDDFGFLVPVGGAA